MTSSVFSLLTLAVCLLALECAAQGTSGSCRDGSPGGCRNAHWSNQFAASAVRGVAQEASGGADSAYRAQTKAMSKSLSDTAGKLQSVLISIQLTKASIKKGRNDVQYYLDRVPREYVAEIKKFITPVDCMIEPVDLFEISAKSALKQIEAAQRPVKAAEQKDEGSGSSPTSKCAWENAESATKLVAMSSKIVERATVIIKETNDRLATARSYEATGKSLYNTWWYFTTYKEIDRISAVVKQEKEIENKKSADQKRKEKEELCQGQIPQPWPVKDIEDWNSAAAAPVPNLECTSLWGSSRTPKDPSGMDFSTIRSGENANQASMKREALNLEKDLKTQKESIVALITAGANCVNRIKEHQKAFSKSISLFDGILKEFHELNGQMKAPVKSKTGLLTRAKSIENSCGDIAKKSEPVLNDLNTYMRSLRSSNEADVTADYAAKLYNFHKNISNVINGLWNASISSIHEKDKLRKSFKDNIKAHYSALSKFTEQKVRGVVNAARGGPTKVKESEQQVNRISQMRSSASPGAWDELDKNLAEAQGALNRAQSNIQPVIAFARELLIKNTEATVSSAKFNKSPTDEHLKNALNVQTAICRILLKAHSTIEKRIKERKLIEQKIKYSEAEVAMKAPVLAPQLAVHHNLPYYLPRKG